MPCVLIADDNPLFRELLKRHVTGTFGYEAVEAENGAEAVALAPQVRPDLIEAARAYGASPWQMLTKVQMPLAMPSIMAGINQSLMLSLSMVVIASMIAVGGLGLMVLRGIGRLDMGLATVGGIGIVILAILLDRVTQAMGRHDRRSLRWHQRGPIGLAARLLQRQPAHPATPATSATAQA